MLTLPALLVLFVVLAAGLAIVRTLDLDARLTRILTLVVVTAFAVAALLWLFSFFGLAPGYRLR